MHVADLRTALAVPRPKVSVPRRIDRAVERPRLLRGLTGAPFDEPDATAGGVRAPGPVVLFACAPAGYGKTTMLADWTEQQRAAGVPIAWVTCDRDDDGTAFWSAVIIGHHRGRARLRDGARPDSTHPAGPADPTFVANLIGVLGDEVPGIVLVLDDVHEVRAREVLDGIQHLVEWADGQVRVALGCRFEPPIGLHRLRLTGRLHEVRAAQLAFTADEADDFWDRHDIVLDADSRAVLHTPHRGLAGRDAAGGTVARARRPGHVRRRVQRRRPPGGRLPDRRGAGPPARRRRRLPAAHLRRRGPRRRPRGSALRSRRLGRHARRPGPAQRPRRAPRPQRHVVQVPRPDAHLPRGGPPAPRPR